MTQNRCRQDSAVPHEAERDFDSDDADMLCGECLMLNRGIVPGAEFRMFMYNLPSVYRVVVTTDVEETDIEFWKLTGCTRLWRDGVEVSVN